MLLRSLPSMVLKTVLLLTVATLAVAVWSSAAAAQGVQLDDEPVIVNPETADSEDAADGQESPQIPNNFNYIAEECNNLTLLVRKSIQIYDAQTGGNNLSPAHIVYAETKHRPKTGLPPAGNWPRRDSTD